MTSGIEYWYRPTARQMEYEILDVENNATSGTYAGIERSTVTPFWGRMPDSGRAITWQDLINRYPQFDPDLAMDIGL